MLSSAILSPLLFSLFVQCAPAPGSDPLQTAGIAGDLQIISQTTTSTASLQAPFPIDALHSQPNAISDSSNSLLLRPATAVPPAPIDPPSSQVSKDSTRPLVMAYYPDWAGPDSPPEKINFKLLDWIDFAFAMPNENCDLTWDSEGAPELLGRLVHVAHAAGTKVKLSIGGWTGSKYFSPAVSTNKSREACAKNILQLYIQYNLDGIDIDWEYPGHEGAIGNKVDPLDLQNFLSLLWCLRTTLPPDARITVAAETVPFSIPGFAAVLDWVLIMNYDVWLPSSNPGPNAPMHDGCKNSTQPEANVVSAYNAWTSAGFSPSQLVLGLPSYGMVSSSNATGLRTRINSPSLVTLVADGGGQIQFRNLVSQGALVPDPYKPCSFVAAGGFERHWDDCSSTPFLRSPSVGQVISYDDPESLGMKVELADKLRFLGVNIFDAHGDTDQWELMNSMRKGLGLSSTCG